MDSSIQNSYNNSNSNSNIRQQQQRGHIRSASLENANSFISKNTLGLPVVVQPGFNTGTLKSRNEQKRLRNKFGSQSNLEDYVQQSRSKFQNIRSMFESTKSVGGGGGSGSGGEGVECEREPQRAQPQQLQPQTSQQQIQLHQHPHQHQQQPQQQQLQQQQQQQQMHPINQINHSQYQQQNIHTATVMHVHPELGHRGSNISNYSNGSGSNTNNLHQHHHPQLKRTTMGGGVEYSDSLNIVEADSGCADRVNRAEKTDQATNLLRPIAFKPIPFEPDYSIPVRYNELSDRYGSTPSLAPVQGSNLRFGSTTDLRHGYSSSNSYCNNLMARRRCSRSLKINDSMESIRHTPDSDAISQNSTLKSNCGSNKYIISEQFDMTPSPSDSGVSDLEAALKDRDSELSYLRQTMEHNEKVIFKVQKDKEAYWENETKRLKAYYENQQKEFLLKIKKMEQMLTLQSFQFKQNKLRITENTNRLKEQFGDLKKESELLKNENEGLKTSERSIRDCINQLEEKTRIMDGLIGNLKAQLEENEWTVCQRNGEIALLKNQLKEANIELAAKDQEILHLKHDQSSSTSASTEPTPSAASVQAQEVEISQLNRIIILKDQVILALTNELGKLRKELSDLAIFHEYGEEPSGKLSRLKYQIDKISTICQKNQMNHDEKPQKDLSPKTIDESNLEVIMNCLQIVPPFIEPTQRTLDRHNIMTPESRLSQMTTDIQNFVYGTLNLPDIAKNSQFDEKMASKDEVSVLRKELLELRRNFEMERHQWASEKEKVLKYQKQLQMHYISMYQKIKDLDSSSNGSEAV